MTKNNTLSIKIDTKEPMDLKEVMRYLDAIEKEYASYCKNNKNKLELVEGENTRLEIVKLEKGSWVIELMATAITSQSHGINPILGFQQYLTGAIILLAKMRDKDSLGKIPPIILNLKNCFNLIIILGFGNNIQFISNNDESVNKAFSGAETEKALEGAMKYMEELPEEEVKTESLTEQHFYWTNVNFSKPKFSGKGIIEELDEKAHKVIFENDADKEYMVKYNTDLEKDWQDLLYVVTVEVTRKGGKIIFYQILNVEPNKTDEK